MAARRTSSPRPAVGGAFAWLHRFVGFAATKRALDEALLEAAPNSDVLLTCRTAIAGAGTALVERAQRAGVVRDDTTFMDIVRMVGAIAMVPTEDPEQTEAPARARARRAPLPLTQLVAPLDPGGVPSANLGAWISTSREERMSGYTKINLKEIEAGGSGEVETRFARQHLDSEHLGVSLFRYGSGYRSGTGAQPPRAGGGLRRGRRFRPGQKLDDEVFELKTWDAARVAPSTVRAFEGGPWDGAGVARDRVRPSGGRRRSPRRRVVAGRLGAQTRRNPHVRAITRRC